MTSSNGANEATSYYLNQNGLLYWRIYESFSLDELKWGPWNWMVSYSAAPIDETFIQMKIVDSLIQIVFESLSLKDCVFSIYKQCAHSIVIYQAFNNCVYLPNIHF